MKRLTAVLLPALMLTASAYAGFLSNFSELRDELVFRHGVLSNSTDKVEQKQDKTCVKDIQIIEDSSGLGDDIKASAKLAKSLEKAFPSEFEPLVSGVVFSNNVQGLVVDGYFNIADDLDDILDSLQSSVNEMPEGKDREKAQQALNDANEDLEAAFGDTTFKQATKLLGSCEKNAQKASKIIQKAFPK